jgi:hypothetical protein
MARSRSRAARAHAAQAAQARGAKRRAAVAAQARFVAEAPPLGAGPFGRADVRLAAILALCAFLIYNANLRPISAGDCFPARFLPFAILEHGSLYLDSVLEATGQGHPAPYWIIASRDDRRASMYPVVTPLLVTPVYIPAWLYVKYRGWTQQRLSDLGAPMEKLAASLVASCTAGLLFLVLRRRMSRRKALLLAAAFALGTNTWMTGSQGLWQHGTGELFATLALLAMTVGSAASPPSWSRIALAGFLTGLLPANRPPDLALAAGFGIYALFWARKRAPVFVLAAAVPAALTLLYNHWMFNNLSGGYGVIGAAQASFFQGSMLVGIAGLLVSPGKGLFVFSPFLLFLPVLFRRTLAATPESPPEERSHRTLTLCLAGAVILQILLYARADWRAGFSWGPRFLTDMLPLLIWMLAPIVESLTQRPRRLFVAAVLFSVLVQAVGAFYYQGRSDILIYQGPGNPALLAWRPSHTPFWAELENGLAPMEFLRFLGVEERMRLPGNWIRALLPGATGSSR